MMFVAPVEKVSKRVCKEFLGIDRNASHNTVALCRLVVVVQSWQRTPSNGGNQIA